MNDSRKVDAVHGSCGEGHDQQDTTGRRQFLRQTACATGCLLLHLYALPVVSSEANTTEVSTKDSTTDEKKSTDIVLKLSEHPALTKVGGSEVIKTDVGKIIVARAGENTFVACAAACTHRGAQVMYEHGNKHFICPNHGARFELSGKVVRGPARKPLQSYATNYDDTAVIISMKPVERSS